MSRFRTLLATLAVIALLLWLRHRSGSAEPAPSSSTTEAAGARRVRLRVRTRRYTAHRAPNDTVPWSSAPLFGPSAHAIEAVPAVAVLDVARTPKPTDLLFAYTTTAERARSMRPLWQHHLQHLSPCLVVLPPSESGLREGLATALGPSCHVRVGAYDNYEKRVGSVVQEAAALAASLERTTGPLRWLIVADECAPWADPTA